MSRLERPLLCIAIAFVGVCIVYELAQVLRPPVNSDLQVRSAN